MKAEGKMVQVKNIMRQKVQKGQVCLRMRNCNEKQLSCSTVWFLPRQNPPQPSQPAPTDPHPWSTSMAAVP